jgi:hypothetical protein
MKEEIRRSHKTTFLARSLFSALELLSRNLAGETLNIVRDYKISPHRNIRHATYYERHIVKWDVGKVYNHCPLTLSNPIFLPPAYSQALIYFGRERGWWVTCNYPTVLKKKNINENRKSTTCAICWLKSVLYEEKRREQENHNDFPIPDAFPHAVRTLANR